MIFDLKLNNKSSKRLQIENYIKKLINEGLLQRGEKLPSTREMGLMLKVSRNTIIKVYEALCDEGFICTTKGKGTFVSSKKTRSNDGQYFTWNTIINDYAKKAENLDIIKHEMRSKKGMISFDSISPDKNLFDLEEFKRDFLNILSLEGNNILNYGYAKGYKPLIEHLEKYMSNKGIDFKNKDMLITNGFTEGFDIVLSSITKPHDKIICENPTHNTAIKLMKLHNLNITGIDMEDDGINISMLEEELKKGALPKAAYLIPSYHNPTGIVMSPEKRLSILKLLNDYRIPIIEDGFNEELRYSNSTITPIAALSGSGNSVIYIGSFSKILFPGMRIGWIAADKELISYLESVKRSRNIHTSFLDQAILYEYLKVGNFDKYVKRAKKYYKEKYELAIKYANLYIPYTKLSGEGGLHIFVEVKGINSRDILKECYKKGVIFTPGDIFFTNNEGKNTFRLGFSRVDRSEIKAGFKIIGDTIKEFLRRI
ncbi:aminotransferase-like domain-containing protein [Clostridium guangxiense]|uniref:aminotransferase-like domain-containing protein n=1 Tax=Clostridium guangxiense TaxID=1662055 RepID=UPI001E5989F1|nr:PLP-dependent aminotransferase family protein [Clostridium guangxiense]MCD2346961.1 PLP-dependent aminotransferase family protein [Clostridium guangxiense]